MSLPRYHLTAGDGPGLYWDEDLDGEWVMFTDLQFTEQKSRADFESMAAIVYPGALSAGRNKTFGTYVNCNLEKRWQGWKACDEFRAGIVPTRQRGKS